MVDTVKGWLGGLIKENLSWKSLVEFVHGEESITEDKQETHSNTEKSTIKSGLMRVPYWQREREPLKNENQHFIDLFLYKNKVNTLDRIPDTVEGEPIKESRYNFYDNPNLPQFDLNSVNTDIPVTPKSGGAGISNSGRDAGVVAGIVVAVISGVIVLAALIAVVMYRHYVHRNVTSMNFDNPVYRKTTEDQFALEKNAYAPGSKLYPSTVGEEAQEPLNSPGTNDYV